MKPQLVVQFAMRGEAAPLLRRGQFQRHHPTNPTPYGFEYHWGKTGRGHQVLVAVAGQDSKHGVDAIGTLRAGLLAHEIVTQFEPKLLVNAGTAGGFHARGGEIGDVYLGQTPAVFHDRRIPLPGGFRALGEGQRAVHFDPSLAEVLGLKRGVVSTGDSLDCTPEDFQHLLRLGASVKEMEAAAIATVCEAYQTPLILLKSITDIVDTHPALESMSTEDQFLKNYELAVGRLTEKLEGLIELLQTHPT